MNIIKNIKEYLHINKGQKDYQYKELQTQKPEHDIFFISAGIRQPDITPSLPLLQYIHNNSPAIKIATLRLRETIFRRGFEWEPKFECKCPHCGKEFTDKKVDYCDECGSKTIEPDHSEIQRADRFFKKVNVNNQQLLHLLKQVEDDVNVFDDAYIVGIKEYVQDAEGNVVFTSLKEMVRGNPITMRIVANENGELGGKYYTCLHHRDVVEEVKDKKCPKCNRKLYEVHYVSVKSGGESPSTYYIDGEVIHISKYSPSALYGYSPIVTLWDTAMTLAHQMKYVYQSYTTQHLPKGVLAIKTSNPDSAFKFWRDTDDKLQKDPHYIPKMFIEGEGDGVGMEFVRFMDTLEEMQYIPVRDEIRRTIAAIYGITNIFINDTEGVGGLNSEQEQLTITNMAADSAMRVYNDVVLPNICDWLGVRDWQYTLNSPVEQDRMKELDEELKDTQIAQAMLNMGFDVKYNEDGEFEYSGKAINQLKQQQQMLGGLNQNQLVGELGQSQEEQMFSQPSSNWERIDPPPSAAEHELEGHQVREGPKGGQYWRKKGDGKEVAGIYVKNEIQKFAGERDVFRERSKLQNTLNKIFEAEIAKVLSHSGKFSAVEMKKFTKKVLDEAVKKMKVATDEHLKDIYKEGQKYVEDMIGKSITFSAVDENVLKAITEQDVLWKAYTDMSKDLSKKLNNIITESYRKPSEFSLPAMVQKMQLEVDTEVYKLERIVRTETTAASMKGREIAFRKFDPENKFLYKWAVRHDARTSDICKEIEQIVDTEGIGKGVPLDRLNQIMKEVSLRHNGQNWKYRDFTPHINCRSGLVRQV